MIFIGDIHGNLNLYGLILDKAKDESTLQVGDFGFGFFGFDFEKEIQLPLQHRFFRGNHDDPKLALRHPNCIGDFGYFADENLFFIAGAWSIDFNYRKRDKDWWLDEELSLEQFEEALTLYKKTKPRIVVTHEAPRQLFVEKLEKLSCFSRSQAIEFETMFKNRYGHLPRTQDQLQKFFEAWQPEIWIHGHHHRQLESKIGGTRFISLPDVHSKKKVIVYSVSNLSWGCTFNGEVMGKFIKINPFN